MVINKKFGFRPLLWLLIPLAAVLLTRCVSDDELETTQIPIKFSISLTSPQLESEVIVYSSEGKQVDTRFLSHVKDTVEQSVRVCAMQNGKLFHLGRFVGTQTSKTSVRYEVDASASLSAGKPYDLYFIGGGCRWENNNLWYKSDLSRGTGFYTWLKLNVNGSSTPSEAMANIYGTSESLFIINKSGSPIKFKHKGFNADKKWYYTSAEVSLVNGKVENVRDGAEVEGIVRDVPVFTGQNATSIYSFYVPNGNKISDAQLVAEIDGKTVYSENRISSDVEIKTGHAYAMFAVWDGKKLRLGTDKKEAVAKIDLPEGSNLKAEDLTILGDGEEVDVKKDGSFSPEPANLIALNKNNEIVYLSYGNSNQERVLGSVETALALLLPTVPNVVSDFSSEDLQTFKVMTALLKPTYDLVQAIKKSVAKYNYLNMDAIQPELEAAIKELHHRCGLDKDYSNQARKASFSTKMVNDGIDYPYFKEFNSKTMYFDFITIDMTDAQLKEKNGSKYWSCVFDVYNDNRFCYTSFTKSLKTANGVKRYDDSWADTFRYLIKPYNISEFMDRGLISDLAYDPEHFLTTLENYDYSNILEDRTIALFWEPFVKGFDQSGGITTFDKTVQRNLQIDFFTSKEHLVIVGPGMDDNLLLFNIIKIAIQPLLKMYVKSESSSDDLDKFTKEFLKWLSEMDLNFRADLLQHFKDPQYTMWEKISYVYEKLADRIKDYVMDKLYDAASEFTIKKLFGTSGGAALKEYKAYMNMLKTGYKCADILQFLLDSQYVGFYIGIEQGYGETGGSIPNVQGSDF